MALLIVIWIFSLSMQSRFNGRRNNLNDLDLAACLAKLRSEVHCKKMYPCLRSIVYWVDKTIRILSEHRGDIHDNATIRKTVEVRDHADTEVERTTNVRVNFLIRAVQV